MGLLPITVLVLTEVRASEQCGPRRRSPIDAPARTGDYTTPGLAMQHNKLPPPWEKCPS